MWTRKVVKGGSICVRINEENGGYFKPGKGLRQGDPLSPLLFNLVADVFTKILEKAAREQLITGLLTNVCEGGIVSLQYADDTLLFLKNDLDKARNLKWLLVCFEHLSGLKINYDKSDLLTIGLLEEEEENDMAKIFCCKKGEFPLKYLGVPLHHSKLRKDDIQPIVDKVVKRIVGWKGKLLSYGGRLVLLKSCLASIPIYLLSIIKFPIWAIEMINSQMAHFFWDNSEERHKYHLARWPMITQKKEFGGLGVPDLRTLNICLLASWIQRYHLHNNALWSQIIKLKYRTDNPNMFCCSDRNASPFWKGVQWAAQAAALGYQWVVGDGKKVRFWEDHWFGNSSLAVQFWQLYTINNEQGATISQVWDGVDLKLTFRRAVSQQLMLQWDELSQIVNSITLSTEEDAIIWKFNSSGQYSVQSLYAVLNFRGVSPIHIPAVWQLSIPPRVHIFLWLLYNNKLLTRDNLQKRRDVADKTCLFCCEEETVNHLFFDCCVASLTWNYISIELGVQVGSDFESIGRWWISNNKNAVLNCVCAATLWSIWKLRNNLCFQGKGWRGIGQVLCSIARMLRRWSVLLKPDKQAKLECTAQHLLEEGSKPPTLGGSSSPLQESSSNLSRGDLSRLVFTAAPPTIPMSSEVWGFDPILQPIAVYDTVAETVIGGRA